MLLKFCIGGTASALPAPVAADGGPNVVETMLFWQPDTKHICTWIRLLSLYRPAMHCSWATWKHHCQCSTSHIRSNKIQIIIIYITFIYLLCMSTKSNYVTWLKIKVLRSHLSFIILLNLTQMIWTQQLHLGFPQQVSCCQCLPSSLIYGCCIFMISE